MPCPFPSDHAFLKCDQPCLAQTSSEPDAVCILDAERFNSSGDMAAPPLPTVARTPSPNLRPLHNPEQEAARRMAESAPVEGKPSSLHVIYMWYMAVLHDRIFNDMLNSAQANSTVGRHLLSAYFGVLGLAVMRICLTLDASAYYTLARTEGASELSTTGIL